LPETTKPNSQKGGSAHLSGGHQAATFISVEDLGDDACTDRSTTLTDRKTQALFHRNRRNQLSNKVDVVARHHHLNTLR